MKVILGNSNTKWGVIIRPQSSNTYRHVLSFDTPALKDAFINKYIMQDKGDYKQELNNSYNRGVVELDALNIEFRVNADEYPYETFSTLLNKDFCITKDEHGDIKFYAIKSVNRKGNIIQYVAELDIFFTYDIKRDMFNNDSEMQIQRAMTDRVFKDDLHGLRWFFQKKDFNWVNPIYNPEEFDGASDTNLIPYSKPKQLYYDYTYLMRDFTDSLNPPKYAEIVNHALNNLVFDVWADKSKTYEHFKGIGATEEPYSIMSVWTGHTWTQEELIKLLPADEQQATGNKPYFHLSFYIQEDDPVNNYPSSEIVLASIETDGANFVKSSRTQTFIPPWLNTGVGLSKDNFKVSVEKNAINSYTIRVDFMISRDTYGKMLHQDASKDHRVFEFKQKFGHVVYSSHAPSSDPNVMNAKDYYIMWDIGSVGGEESIFTTDQKPLPEPKSMTINDIVLNKHENEIKGYFYPYRKFILRTISTNSKDLAPNEFIDNNNMMFGMMYGYLIESWQTKIDPLLYLTKYNIGYDSNDHKEDIFFNDMTTYQRATTTNAYEEWIVRNKSQFNAGIMANKVNAGMGVVGALGGAIGGFATGNIMGGLGSLFGGASMATKSAMAINQQMAKITDLKRTPNELNGTTSTLLIDQIYKKFNASITEYRVNPQMDILIKEHFYKYGYTFNSKIENINEYLNNRYYFNYIECPETYENIVLQVSAMTKQIINDSIANGLTIWHVRDLNTFKGIKNYKYENLEMSVI